MLDRVRLSEIQRCVSAGDIAGAEAICAGLAEAEGTNPAYWQIRGDIALMARDWAGAEAHYRWTLMLVPEAAKAWLGIARACISAGRFEAGAGAAARAITLGLEDGLAMAAQELIAHARFTQGDIAGGRATLAALLPAYRARLAAGAHLSKETLSGALGVAICAGDTEVVAQVLSAQYPQAATIGPLAIAPLADLADWCRAAGVPWSVVDPPREVRLAPSTPYSRRDRYMTEPVLFASIPGGHWIPGWDFALGSDGTVLADSGYFKLHQVFNHAPHAVFEAAKLVAHRAPPRIVEIDDDVLLISATMHNHVGHWLIDFIPRLLGRERVGRPVKLAVPDTLSRRLMESLTLAGVSEADLIRCSPEARYRFRTLHIYRPGRSMPPHPWHIRYLRRVLRGDDGGEGRPIKGKRVYLSRNRIGTRLVANATEFEACLKEHGFISIELADVSTAEQRRLLADAEVLLSTLGTDLIAMCFMPRGATVISMQWSAGMDNDPCFAPSAGLLGLKHQFLLSQESRASAHARHGQDRDFVVDCAELGRRIREIDAAQSAVGSG